jgi:hypothetical protein
MKQGDKQMTNQEILEIANAIIAMDHKVVALRRIAETPLQNPARKFALEQAQVAFGALCDKLRDGIGREEREGQD